MPSLTHQIILDRISLQLDAGIVVRIMMDGQMEVEEALPVLKSTTQAVQIHTGQLMKEAGNDLNDQTDLPRKDEVAMKTHVHH